jgi:hypothetical protein
LKTKVVVYQSTFSTFAFFLDEENKILLGYVFRIPLISTYFEEALSKLRHFTHNNAKVYYVPKEAYRAMRLLFDYLLVHGEETATPFIRLVRLKRWKHLEEQLAVLELARKLEK